MNNKGLILIAILLPLLSYFPCVKSQPKNTGETVEIELIASGHYDNPYTNLELWLVLSGKGFNSKVYGFWDGDINFKIRLIAPEAGTWKWESFFEPYDKGLSGEKSTVITPLQLYPAFQTGKLINMELQLTTIIMCLS